MVLDGMRLFQLPDVIRTLHCEAEGILRKNVSDRYFSQHCRVNECECIENGHTRRSYDTGTTSGCNEISILEQNKSS